MSVGGHNAAMDCHGIAMGCPWCRHCIATVSTVATRGNFMPMPSTAAMASIRGVHGVAMELPWATIVSPFAVMALRYHDSPRHGHGYSMTVLGNVTVSHGNAMAMPSTAVALPWHCHGIAIVFHDIAMGGRSVARGYHVTATTMSW